MEYVVMSAVFKSIIFMLVAGYAGALVFMYITQNHFTYYPPKEKLPAPAPFEEITIATHDGLELYSWYAKPKKDKATIVYFHGNASKLMDAAYSVMPLVNAGYGALLVEYRGYSGNPGKPREDDIYKDSIAAYDWLVEHHNPKKIVLYGMSLGTGVASYMAENKPANALIIESGYTRLKDVARVIYWYMPVNYLVRETYQSLYRLPNLTIPVLIIHGENDRLIPLEQAKRNFARANEPKKLVVIEGGSHSDLPYNGANAAVLKWLEEYKL
jgi:dipeptidyl aminopeptidase/acylaminoacyl peptidase